MENTPITILSPVGKYRHPQNSESISRLSEGPYDLNLVEVIGLSEVARARNTVASKAYPLVRKRGGYVLWWDADMVLLNLSTFALHLQCVRETGLAISGRYVVRQDNTRLAASIDEFEKRDSLIRDMGNGYSLELEPAMCGMGCLLMTAEAFMAQLESSPSGTRKHNGVETKEHYVCCPRIEPYKGEHIMVSEDFDYCRSIDGGAWLARVDVSDGEKVVKSSWLDYGHIGERCLLHSSSPHSHRDDR